MAIISLIVTPLVMSIIRKARVSSDKRSIDAYGRSIELTIAGYLLDNGKFPTDVSQLTIEYSGSQVVCETTQINPDSSVYLEGCTVAGRIVDYTYGEDKNSSSPSEYSIGDQVNYNGVDYYVLKDAETTDTTVTLLKASALTTEEVNDYGSSASISAVDLNGYGGISYGNDTSYEISKLKIVVDAWAADNIDSNDLQEARLINKEEYEENCEIEQTVVGTTQITKITPQYEWLYNSNYAYWTMSKNGDTNYFGVVINNNGSPNGSCGNGCNGNYTVRPVIVLSKSALN